MTQTDPTLAELDAAMAALRYVLNFADSNSRASTIMKTFTLPDRVTTREKLEQLWRALPRLLAERKAHLAERDEWAVERAVGQQQLDGLVTILHLIRQEATTIIVKPDATWISIPGLGSRRLNEWIDDQIDAALTNKDTSNAGS